MNSNTLSITNQLDQQINNLRYFKVASQLLHKRFHSHPARNSDPVYSHLYVVCEEGSRKRRIKTDRNTEFIRQRNVQKQKYINSTSLKRHRRNLSDSSYTVQLPKISDRFKTMEHASNKVITKQTKRERSLESIKNINSKTSNIVSSVQNKQVQNKICVDPINKKIQVKQKVSNRQSYANRKSNLKMLKKQHNIKILSDWLQIDILKLATYFVKLKHKKQINNQINLQTLNLKLSKVKFMNLPQRSEIPDFIKNYKTLNPNICVDSLVKSVKFGILFQQNQSIYFGHLENGKKVGEGIYICANYRFEGSWRNEQKVSGYQITGSGYFRGKFYKNKRHGEGQYYWNNGESYSGDWRHGQKEGSGIWKSGKGDSYVGQWKQGKVHGHGNHKTANNQQYVGYFQSFLKSGHGKETFPNGDTYEGHYKFGHSNGKGKYIWKNGIQFVGVFSNGYRKGLGTILANNYLSFTGEFDRDLPNGNGKLSYQNGDQFVGQFKNGEKHGKGTFNYKHEHKIQTGLWLHNKFQFNQEKQCFNETFQQQQ